MSPIVDAEIGWHGASSGYAGRVEVLLGPTDESLEGPGHPLDPVFIDADKSGYTGYYEAVLLELAAGARRARDNVSSPPDVVFAPEPIRARCGPER